MSNADDRFALTIPAPPRIAPHTIEHPAQTANWLLTALSPVEQTRVLPHLQQVTLKRDQTLFESGATPHCVYFVEQGVISLQLTSRTGTEVEVANIGREGLVGDAALLGCHRTMTRAVTLVEGSAWRLPAALMHDELRRTGTLQNGSIAYLQMLLHESFQLELCNRRHTVEQRLARWLLLLHDRSGTSYWPLTQETLSCSLGTRRPGVTDACAALRDAGLIAYQRGRFEIVNVAGLQAASCECYHVMSEATRNYATRLGLSPAPKSR